MNQILSTGASIFGVMAGLIFIYLLLSQKNTPAVIGALDNLNVNDIRALQGR